jgi:hypothetical protein
MRPLCRITQRQKQGAQAMRARTWAIRVTFANGREALLRQGGVIGRGLVASFYSQEQAEKQAAFIREGMEQGDIVTVFERSHGRRDASK